MRYDVFLSFPPVYEGAALSLAEALESASLRCCLPGRELPTLTSYGPDITAAVRECKAVVLMMDRDTRARTTTDHADIARSCDVPTVPFVLAGDTSVLSRLQIYELTEQLR